MMDSIDPGILAPAFAAGCIVLLTHVPLGREVLNRNIIFIDLALAQIAALGIVVAHVLQLGTQGWLTQAIAVTSALSGAVLLNWTEKHWPDVQEALIGVAFILAATGGLLLLAHNPHGGERMRELLAGQILWTSWHQTGIAAIGTALLLAVWYGLRQRTGRLRFYLVFAIAVTMSVQLVGVYLVFASLIIPALVTRQYPESKSTLIAYSIGITGYLLGLFISAIFDLPSGPMITWSLAMTALIFSVILRK
jgi:zinc/manganese transport system permease protein